MIAIIALCEWLFEWTIITLKYFSIVLECPSNQNLKLNEEVHLCVVFMMKGTSLIRQWTQRKTLCHLLKQPRILKYSFHIHRYNKSAIKLLINMFRIAIIMNKVTVDILNKFSVTVTWNEIVNEKSLTWQM